MSLLLILFCVVERAANNQLYILHGGVFGADVRGAAGERHSACVVHSSTAEDGYRAG